MRKPKAKRGILSYFPGTPRPLQRDALLEVEANWDKADVFLMNLPVGAGKSKIAVTIAKWATGQAKIKGVVTTPTNLLVDQYLRDNPQMAVLKSKDSYVCSREGDGTENSCGRTKARTGRHCSHCPYTASIRKAHAMPFLVCNNHIYLAHKLTRELFISDEAHNLVRVIKDRAGKILWDHDYSFPSWIRSYSDLHTWVLRHPDLGEDPKLQLLLEELENGKTRYVINRGEELYRGVPTPCIRLSPVDVRDYPPIFWNRDVKKIVLLSATIGMPDVVQLGLDKKRVYAIHASSPVDAERRPVVFSPVSSLQHGYSIEEIEKLAAFIESKMRARVEKGLIHATYKIAAELRAILGDHPRLLWHTKEDAKEKYQEFLAAAPESGKILVASGLYEGADLPYDQARWQILTKIPWPYLGEPAIQYLAKQDPEWYRWETVKTVLQAAGRIVRGVDDWGITWIPDKSFERLVLQSEHLMPQWWLDGLMEEEAERT